MQRTWTHHQLRNRVHYHNSNSKLNSSVSIQRNRLLHRNQFLNDVHGRPPRRPKSKAVSWKHHRCRRKSCPILGSVSVWMWTATSYKMRKIDCSLSISHTPPPKPSVPKMKQKQNESTIPHQPHLQSLTINYYSTNLYLTNFTGIIQDNKQTNKQDVR